MMLFAVGLNTRSAWRFNARMTPIRASMVGPPCPTISIGASIVACHSGESCLALRAFPASRRVLWLGRAAGSEVAMDQRRPYLIQSHVSSTARATPTRLPVTANVNTNLNITHPAG
jgi:hypothetical protein